MNEMTELVLPSALGVTRDASAVGVDGEENSCEAYATEDAGAGEDGGTVPLD